MPGDYPSASPLAGLAPEPITVSPPRPCVPDADRAGGRDDFLPISRWAPRGVLRTAGHPRLLWQALRNVPVSVRIDPDGGDLPPGHHHIVRWTFDPARYGARLCLTFTTRDTFVSQSWRWRLIARVIAGMVATTPGAVFHDVPVDLSDCGDSTVPPDVLRFVRRPGDVHDLLPNPLLLAARPPARRPPPWERKAGTVFFRGASTGSRTYTANNRVALCLCARSIPAADCKLSAFPQVDPDFLFQARRDGIVGRRCPPAALARHRYLVDADGNTSSWDRFALIGSFGGLPIRFETAWEEYWHPLVRDGEHYVSATRDTLRDEVEGLRTTPDRARHIAASAHALARDALSPSAVRHAFASIWRRRTSLHGSPDRPGRT